jgi:hypothetical protein
VANAPVESRRFQELGFFITPQLGQPYKAEEPDLRHSPGDAGGSDCLACMHEPAPRGTHCIQDPIGQSADEGHDRPQGQPGQHNEEDAIPAIARRPKLLSHLSLDGLAGQDAMNRRPGDRKGG